MNKQYTSKSVAIERVGYDASTRALTVWFRGSRRYDFRDVPAEVYEQLCEGGDVSAPPCERLSRGTFPRLGRMGR